jgi:hypothetical protein
MALAILLGGFFGLLVAGGVLVVGTIRHARREEAEMHVAFAEARGEPRSSEVGPAVWSSFDMESLREGGYDVDPSDPYATLTGELTVSSSEISWSESTLADGHAPRANVATESVEFTESVVIAEPADADEAADVDEAAEIEEPAFIDEPAEIDEPVSKIPEPVSKISEPADIGVPLGIDVPLDVPEPVAAGAAPVARRSAPAPVREDEPVVWRAPAQSQVIILAVSLRALADAVAATVTHEAWERFDDAYAQVRSRVQGEGGARRPSPIDVHAHERRPSTGRANGGARRRSAPPRRPAGPARITWRAR